MLLCFVQDASQHQGKAHQQGLAYTKHALFQSFTNLSKNNSYLSIYLFRWIDVSKQHLEDAILDRCKIL